MKNVTNQENWIRYGRPTTPNRQRSRSFSGSLVLKIPNENIGTTTDNHTPETESPTRILQIKTYLKPIILFLTISGLYSVNNVRNCIVCIYRTVLFAIVVLNLAKFIVACFFIPRTSIVFNALYIIWLSMCLCNYLVHLKSTNNRFGNQETSFENFDAILLRFQEHGVAFPEARIKRDVVIATTIGCSVVVINMAGVGLQISFHSPSKDLYSAPFDTDWFSIAFFMLAQLICTCAWIFPWIYTVTVCDIMKHTFVAYTTYLKKTLCKNDCTIPIDIKTTRQLHLKLCNLVGEFDADLSWFFACFCCTNIGLTSVALYQLVKASLDEVSIFLVVFWMISSMALVGIVTIFAATVNDKAHAPLDTIYSIDVNNASLDQINQLNLFLSKLNGTQVGFTTCGLLTITKEFILTIVGVFLTYFAVLYTL